MIDLLQLRRRIMLNMEIEEYILFVDSLMEQICATLWGDGVGIKPSQAARVIGVPTNLTTNKKTVTSFDEFQYFINTTTLSGSGLTEANAAGAFTNCTALTSITLPDSLVTIGAGTFKGCSSLDITNNTLPNVTTIGAAAFVNSLSASSTFELDCPNLTSIGRAAFQGSNIYAVKNLGRITSLTGGNIHGVFYNCPRLVSASLPSTLTTLGSHCFEKCYSLTSMPGIENVVTFNEACLAGVPLSGELHLTNAQTLGTYLWQRSGTAKHATITKVYLPAIVTLANGTSTSGSGAFDQMTTLEEVYLGNNCNQIGTFAFRGCSALTKCDLPSSVTVIGENAFNGCRSLEIDEINLPNLTSIGSNSFWEVTKIAKIKSLGSITSLPNANASYGIFHNCTGLTEVTLPNTLQTMGPSIFAGCSNCTKCNLPTSLTSIGDSAFYGRMVNEEEINLPNLTYIGPNNFINNQNVKRIVNLGTITSLPGANSSYGIFRGCTQLQSAVLPSTLQTIGQGIFGGCTALTSVTFSGSNLTAVQRSAFDGCTSLNNINIPTSITTLGPFAFASCPLGGYEVNLPNLTSMDFAAFYHSGVSKIVNLGSITNLAGMGNYGAFDGCTSLVSAIIPSTLTTCGIRAFYGCTALQTVVFLSTTPPTLSNTNAFSGTTCLIYVPYSADHSILAAYKSASGWKTFASRIYELDANGNIPT